MPFINQPGLPIDGRPAVVFRLVGLVVFSNSRQRISTGMEV